MTTARLILLLLLILVAVVLVVVLLRRGSTQRDAQRVEAADLRTRADGLATTMSGQTAFADQAAERAEVARVEAERQAREAQRLEAEAAEQRAAVEATQRDYETTMRRADDIDPDVKESSFPPVGPPGATDSDGAQAQPTRAERRQAREAEQVEAAERAGAPVEPEPSAPTVGAAALGASTRPTRDDEDAGLESERIASAADFRDDVPVDPAQELASASASERTEVFPPSAAGGGTGMDEHRSTGTEARSEPADDLSHDAESPQGEWGGPPHDTSPDDIADPDPDPDPVDEADAATDEPDAATDHAPAEAGAAVAETADVDRSAADLSEEPAEERYDPTPTRDWAADEGELLEETHDRSQRLEAERAELAQQAGDGATDATASEEATDATASDDASERPASEGRRISAFTELRDGGFGVGSAAPLHDGAQPLDHPVQADLGTRTFRVPGDPGYDSAEPDVWFYDGGAAERSGFRRADG